MQRGSASLVDCSGVGPVSLSFSDVAARQSAAVSAGRESALFTSKMCIEYSQMNCTDLSLPYVCLCSIFIIIFMLLKQTAKTHSKLGFQCVVLVSQWLIGGCYQTVNGSG